MLTVAVALPTNIDASANYVNDTYLKKGAKYTLSISAVYSRATHFMYDISMQMFRKDTEVV